MAYITLKSLLLGLALTRYAIAQVPIQATVLAYANNATCSGRALTGGSVLTTNSCMDFQGFFEGFDETYNILSYYSGEDCPSGQTAQLQITSDSVCADVTSTYTITKTGQCFSIPFPGAGGAIIQSV
ncbi:hypothetical protein B7463_g6639, partial [Scytalidium lignicola]